MKKTGFLILLFVLIFTMNVSAQITFEKGTWKEVKEKATRENKLIFLDAYADWCGPCKWMAKNTFTDAKVGEYFNANFINYKLDMEKGEGIKFAQTYPLEAYPTLFFIKGDGTTFHKTEGALDVSSLLSLGEEVQAKNNGETPSDPEPDPEPAQETWEDLNNKAWNVYERGETNKQKLEEAITWAEQSTQMEKNYYNSDTMAHLLAKVGRRAEALKWANEAVKLGKAAGEDVASTQKLVQKLKTGK